VAVVGSYGIGLTVELDRVPEAGETVVGRTFRTDHGGKGSNQAVGAVRLGADVHFLTAVGDDAFGHAAIALWQTEGVDTEAVVVPQAATMTAPIFVEPTGANRIVIVPGALDWLTRAHVDAFAPRIASSDVCAVQLEIPVDTALYALEVARRAGVRTILDPAPAPPTPIAPEVDYLTPNATEAAAVRGAPRARTWSSTQAPCRGCRPAWAWKSGSGRRPHRLRDTPLMRTIVPSRTVKSGRASSNKVSGRARSTWPLGKGLWGVLESSRPRSGRNHIRRVQ
jgi:ribokinase